MIVHAGKKVGLLKRMLLCLCALLALVGGIALAEDTCLYEIQYDDSMTQGFTKTYNPFPETILFLYDEQDDQVLVMLLDKASYPSTRAYLENAYEELKEYQDISGYTGVMDYSLPSGEDALMTQLIVEEDDANFKEYSLMSDAGDYFMSVQISIALTKEHDERWADTFFETFLNDSFALTAIPIDDKKVGYVRGMERAEAGNLILNIELVEFIAGEDEYDYSIKSLGEALTSYTIMPGARVYLPRANEFYQIDRLNTPDEIETRILECQKVQPDFLIEMALKDNEIIWLDYCDLI